jgi:thiol-disulfide isomerase/thioredoxin
MRHIIHVGDDVFKRVIAAALLGLVSAAAMAFSLTDSQGKVHRLADYKGKWVLVNFWATWCPPCLEEIPDLVALHEDRNNNLVVIGIALDYKSPKQVLDFAEQMMISYPIVLGNYAMTAQIGPVRALPMTYLYDPQGKLVAQNMGPLTRKDVEQFIHRTRSGR